MQTLVVLSILFLAALQHGTQQPPTDPQATHSGHTNTVDAVTDGKPIPADLDPLQDAGVSAADRVQALEVQAKTAHESVAAAAWKAIQACDTCLAANDLAEVLASRPATELQPLIGSLLAKMQSETTPRPRAAAARALLALPIDQQPAEVKALQPIRLKTISVVGRMAWDPKEFTVAPASLVCMKMENPDTMQHNMLLVAPNSISEIGVAAEKMGEGLLGKRRQFVPDNPKVLQVMGLVAPGHTGEMWFFAPQKPGTYPLVCTYPGHWRLMNGKLKVK